MNPLPRLDEQPMAPFCPEEYPDDAALILHITELSASATHSAREQLRAIADHIQTSIVEPGCAADHLDLLNAILTTDMPGFSYPAITSALEAATKTLTRSASKPRLQLAPIYKTLWLLTQKSTYLHLFITAVRQCYQALARGKEYPHLGVDTTNPQSVASAIRFLNANRKTLWILNEKYDLDNLIHKLQSSPA